MPETSFLQRLKERKLVQWGLAYLGGAFVVFQLLDALAEPLGISAKIQQAVIAAVAVGFLITLVLAWYHGEKGRQRVSGPELLMVAALLVVAGVAVSMLNRGDEGQEAAQTATRTSVEEGRPSIAVLPFDDFSPNPDDAYFAHGMHEEIISKLSRVAALRVISRNSVMQYREEKRLTPQVAAELGVDFIVEGSARIAGEQVRLTAQLIEAKEDQHLWSREYDRLLTVENLISVQSDIAQRVAQAVGAVLTPEEEDRIEAVPSDNLGAYEAYLLGLYHLGRSDDPADAFPEAVRLFRLAIQQDPNLAVAHSALARAHFSMAAWGVSDPREAWPRVEQWARSALAIDSTLAEARLYLAQQRLARTWDWAEAEREIQRAIELSPSLPLARMRYGNLLMAQGRIEEAWREGRIAVALEPFWHLLQAGWAFNSRKYGEAEQLVEAFLTRDPNDLAAGFFLILCFVLGGHPEQAAQLLPDPPTVLVGGPADRAPLALYLSLTGDADSARVELDRAFSRLGGQYLEPLFVWATYAALGEREEAFLWMDRSIEVESYQTMFLGVTPLADPLRDDPRYQALLDRIGLGHLKARFDSLAAARHIP